MDKLEPEYPTQGQIKETLQAHLQGGDALMELIRKRRAANAEDAQRNERANGDRSDS